MEALSCIVFGYLFYTLPFSALKTHAIEKNPTPTAAKP